LKFAATRCLLVALRAARLFQALCEELRDTKSKIVKSKMLGEKILVDKISCQRKTKKNSKEF
jgi:hypothetical protein